MRRGATAILGASALLASGPVLAEDPSPAPPRAEVSLRGANPSYVGQMVPFEVDLLRDNRSPDQPAPFFPEVRADDAIVLLSEHAPPPDVRDIDGVSFLVQKRTYLVFPQAPGDLTVPPISIALPDGENKTKLVSTKPLRLHADIPPGARDHLPLIARDVHLERAVAPALDHLHVGDAFTVTLKLTAHDTDPVILPALEFPEIPGLARYPSEGSVAGSTERGQFVAERIIQVTYVAKDFGFYELPRQSILWLDPATGRYSNAVAAPISFRARVHPALGVGCLGGPRAVSRFAGSVLLLALTGFALRALTRRIAERQAKRTVVSKNADERAAFTALCAAAKTNQDDATLTALYRWLRFVTASPSTLGAWLRGSSNALLLKPITELEIRVATGRGPGQAHDIVRPLIAYRRSQNEPGEQARLPDLNARPEVPPAPSRRSS